LQASAAPVSPSYSPAVPAPAASAAPGDTLDLPSASARGGRPLGRGAAAGVHHLDDDALRRFATLEDALASLPGFRVRRAGGLGGYSELSFRGARASVVEVYVDGVRLNQDGDGAPDLSKWPALWFSSLTARTGFDAAGAGPGALARIDLSTQSGHSAEVHARGGSFGTGEAAVHATHAPAAAAGWRLTASLQGQAARNDYTVNSDNGTPYNLADDRAWRMDNNAYTSRGARAAARRDQADGSQELSVLWLDARKEYPGLFPATARAYTRRTDWLAAWRMTRAFDGFDGFGLPDPSVTGDAGAARAAWSLSAQARRFEDSYRDPNQTLGPFSFEQARVNTAAELAATASAPLPLSPHAGTWSTRLEARLRAEDVDPTRKPFTQQMESPAAERYEAGAGLRATARDLPLFPAALALTVEARPTVVHFRADGVRSFPSGPLSAPVAETFAPLAVRAVAEWPTPSGKWGTWGLVARREPRVPSSGEFLGDNNGIRHNPLLRPEEARSVSLFHAVTWVPAAAAPTVSAASPDGQPSRGGTASASMLSLESSLYLNHYHDPIRLAQRGASPFLRYENAAAYRVLGAEWSAHAVTAFVDGTLAVTLQDASMREGAHRGKRPAHLSEAEAHAEVFAKPGAGVRLGTSLDFRGPYYPGDANVPVSRRGAEWEWGAHAGYARGPVRLALDARNLLDRRYRDFAYSPRSGRAWSLTLSFML